MCRLWCKCVWQKINASNYEIALYLQYVQSSTAFHWFKSPSSWTVVIWATRQWKNYVGKLIWYPFSINIHLNVILLSFWKWIVIVSMKNNSLATHSASFPIVCHFGCFLFPHELVSSMILSTRFCGCLLVKTFYIHFIINSL